MFAGSTEIVNVFSLIASTSVVTASDIRTKHLSELISGVIHKKLCRVTCIGAWLITFQLSPLLEEYSRYTERLISGEVHLISLVEPPSNLSPPLGVTKSILLLMIIGLISWNVPSGLMSLPSTSRTATKLFCHSKKMLSSLRSRLNLRTPSRSRPDLVTLRPGKLNSALALKLISIE